MKIGRALAVVLLVGVAAAIVAQDHMGALQYPLFNTGVRAMALFSGLALAGSVALALALGAEWWWQRDWRWARAATTGIGMLVLVEAIVSLVDITLVSRSPTAVLGGPYYETKSTDGWVWLRKHGDRGTPSTPEAMFAARFGERYALAPSVPRLLFLGDSYTEGSASALEHNYPKVAERTIARVLGRPVEVMNAGVAGYGPFDALQLLAHLRTVGFSFDAVVFNLYVGNDITDNLPGTERRIVAGVPGRFPVSTSLRMLHPVNSRTVRYALVGRTMLNAGAAIAAPGGGGGALRQTYIATMRERLELTYGARRDSLPLEHVHAALHRMRETAAALGVPFAVVVHADPLVVDPVLRAAVGADAPAAPYDLGRLDAWLASLPADLLVMTSEALAERGEWFLPNDTHLNDAGNVHVGEYVGGRLAAPLAAVWPRGETNSPR